MAQSHYPGSWLEKRIKKTEGELSYQIGEKISQTGEGTPEITRSIMSLYSIVIHAVLSEAITVSQLGLEDPTLQYVEAGRFLIQGVKQVRDEDTHRPIVTKVKGFTNIASGIGLTVLTGVCTTLGATAAVALSAQGLAAGLGVAFVLSCDEVIRTARKTLDPQYWLVDSLKQWDKLNEKTIPKLIADIHKLENTPWISQKNAAATWALSRKKERLQQLQKLEQELGEDIRARATTNPLCWKAYQKHFVSTSPNSNLAIKAQKLIGDQPDFNNPKAKEIEAKIKDKCEKEFEKALNIALLTGLSFVGALLLCIPGAQPIGALLIGIAAAIVTVKYAKFIADEAPKMKNQAIDFFRSKSTARKNRAKGEGLELQPLLPSTSSSSSSRGGSRPA